MPDSNAIRTLADAALAARANAFDPYPSFHLGAAVVPDNGASSVGAGVENAGFELISCLERVAILTAINDLLASPIKL